ncbi:MULTISPECIES: membrane-associated oxidoreductase [unclassified Streptomyces]|uniref:membrane-associated oxidoreductase n=1 Tax=unclassified Streptomyces TaxID=2593676 RepID=UPI001F04CE19|nr:MULTISPECIES: membrane-associated oxidoreductase [unclassified Streptomyces]MCH0563496.1 membrane-associated oxidoreductase [Streptomyces sp. MUM 2J]MCH0570192.1 membrane-associated oxidoreductase [Streptomyces sp. MUM 136J]
MEIGDLTPAERRVRDAFATGVHLDFRPSPDDRAADGAGWGAERTVRAHVLRALLLDGPRQDGEIPALNVAGARITGRLDLQYAAIDHPVRLRHCHFAEAPRCYAARLRELNLSESVLPGLVAHAVHVDGVLRLTRTRCTGTVRLGGARISGSLYLEGAEVSAPDGDDPVLQLNQAAIGADLWAPGLHVRGQARLNGAGIAGTVNLNEARLHHAGRAAFDAETLSAGGHVLLRGAEVLGWAGLRGARIPGRLDLSYARLSNPGGPMLRASSSTIGELWLRKGPPMEGSLNLRRAQIERLVIEPESMPGEVMLADLTYTSLTPHEPAERRLPMLTRDRNGYVPHAYQQLTAAYRRIGDDHAARLVQLAKQRRHRRTLPWYGRLWGLVQDVAVGYGFRPLRAAGWLLSLLAIGSVAFALHHPHPLKADEAPPFDPVFYTLDLLLPVISFGQEAAFAPAGWYQTLSYVLVVTGWILATTVLAGVTRSVSRQ